MKCTLPARIALFAILACGSPMAGAATCYVNSAATGSNSGTSWANAYTNLQSALGNYPACVQVWIARGTYKPTATADRTISFNVKPGVLVYGGFAGTEGALANRVLAANPTILSGDIGVAGDSSDNSYHVVVLDGTTADGVIVPSTLLADLTIGDGNANGAGANEASGGGVYCNGQGAGHQCSPELGRVVFENNSAQAGAAMYNDGHGGGASSPYVHYAIVRNNQAPGGAGGGIYNNGSGGGTSSPLIEQVTFTGNSADLGGAIYDYGLAGTSNPTIRNSTFYSNTASTYGGAMLNNGASGGHASPIIRYSTFHKNRAINGQGGAIYNIAPSADAAPNLSGVIFWADQAVGSPVENYTSFSATVSSLEYSITPECPGGAVGCINADPLLGSLQDNGGFAPTLRPQIGSPAIDAGNATNCPSFDERGIARPQGAQCDIGAVELRDAELRFCYVNAAAGSTENGLTWATAYKTLTPGLVDSNCTEVWVAQGTYKPTAGVDRTSAYYLPPGKAVYGGFAGTETLRSQRNPAIHETILSGEIGAAGASDNVYHVVVADAAASAADIGSNTVLDGFTVSGGNANGSNLQGYGGGLLCNGQGHSCNPTLSNLVFSANQATLGGALLNYGFAGGSSPTLTNVTFMGNQASDKGGAVFNFGNGGASSPVLTAITFDGNYAAHEGGAMVSSAINGVGNPQVSHSTFSGNASSFGGGAVYIEAAHGSFIDVDFVDNSATAIGGAVEIDDAQAACTAAFTSVRFTGNAAGSGGAVDVVATRAATAVSFDHATFAGNVANAGAAGYGGAFKTSGGSAVFSDALFLRNGDGANTYGGGAIAVLGGNASVVVDRAAFVGNSAFLYGGAVWVLADSSGGTTAIAQIANATFWGNVARSGSGVAARANGAQAATFALKNVTFSANNATFGNGTVYHDAINNSTTDSTSSIADAIFWGNTTSVQVLDSGVNTTIDHSVVQGSCDVNNLCSAIILTDPFLGNLQSYGGFTPALMPAANSPAVNAGSLCAPIDQRGVTRPQGASCDMGSVERRAVEDYLFNNGFDF